MNIIIVAATLVGSIILAPIASMSIAPIREALLGLAPEEQILVLADKIDESRVSSEEKLAALQQELDSAKQIITDQKDILEKQNAEQVMKEEKQASELAKQKTETSTLASKLSDVASKAECTELYRKNSFCNQDRYRKKKDFDSEIKNKKEFCDEDIMKDKKDSCLDNVKDETKEMSERFDTCQEIIKKCD